MSWEESKHPRGDQKNKGHFARSPFKHAPEEHSKDPRSITNPLPHWLTPEQKVAELGNLSVESLAVIKSILRDVFHEAGVEGKSSAKEPHKILEKAKRPSIVAEKPWHDVEHLRDSVRWKAPLHHWNQIGRIVDVVAKHGVTLVKVDSKKMFEPKGFGWRFFAVDVRMPNGQLAEFYMPLAEMDVKPVKGPNHELFEKWRNVPMEEIEGDPQKKKEYEKDVAQSKRSYSAAFDMALKRMGYKGMDDPKARRDYEEALEAAGMSSSMEAMNGAASESGTQVQTSFTSLGEKPGGSPGVHLSAPLASQPDVPSEYAYTVPSLSSRKQLVSGISLDLHAEYTPVGKLVEKSRKGARTAALMAVASGQLQMTLHEGAFGVWANDLGGRFFVDLALADRAVDKPVGKESQFTVWAHGQDRQPVQLVVDPTGKIHNADEVLQYLLGLPEEDRAEAVEELAKEYEEADKKPEEEEGEEGQVEMCAFVEGTEQWLQLSQEGEVLNWSEVELAAAPHYSGRASRYTRVRPHFRDGHHVDGYVRKSPSGVPVHPVAPKGAPEGSKFLGYAPHAGFNPKVKKGEEPAQLDAPGHWAVHKHPVATKGVSGTHGLYHPETGEPAPQGVETGWLHGEDDLGGLRKGYVQAAKGKASAVNDPTVEDQVKTQECVALSQSLPALKKKIARAFREPGLTKEKLAACVVLLMNRQCFRVGSKVGDSSVKTKGGVGDTFGVTVLQRDHVSVKGNEVTFEFPGKSGKPWFRIDSDPRTAKVVRELLRSSDGPNESLWQYEDGRGGKSALQSSDVSGFVREFGFTNHNFRHYYASLTYFQACVMWEGDNGTPTSAAQSKSMDRFASTYAAEKVNDEVATVQKSYILKGLRDKVLEGKVPGGMEWLRNLDLAQGEDAFDLPYENEFTALLYLLAHLHEKVGELDLDATGAPPKATGPDEHWVTLKPHGPDHPDYKHVLIRKLPDGSAKVVWSGGGSLNHLRLNKVGGKSEIEKAQAKKPKVLSPEQADAEKAARQKRQEALDSSRSKFGEELTKNLGLDGLVEPERVLSAFEQGFVKLPGPEKKPRTEADDKLEESKSEEEGQAAESGELPEGVKPVDQPDDLPETVARRLVEDLLGEDPGLMKENVPPELKEAWDAMREDPDHLRKVNSLVQGYRKEQAKIKREMRGEGGSIRVIGTMGFYADDPAAHEAELLKDALQQAQKDVRSAFVHRAETLTKAGKYFAQGYGDAVSHAMMNFGGSNSVLNMAAVDLFSPQVVAEAVANHIRGMGDDVRQKALDEMESSFVDKEFATVQEAMARADEMRQERVSIERDRSAGNILDSAASRALAEATILEKKHLARASGSLEGMAQVLDSLRQATPRPIHVKLGSNQDTVLHNFERAGMVEGEDFHLTTEGVQIPADKAGKFVKVLGKASKLDEERALIKSHAANTPDFEVPGMSQDFRGSGPIKLTDTQQATIRAFESDDPVTDHKLLGNIGVGEGKTILFGAAHARLMPRLQAEGKNHHGHYMVPANLVVETMKGLQEAFPDMDIVTTAGKDKKKRESLYGEKHELTLISSDIVREDAEHLAGMYGSDEHRPGAVYGDEVHALFSPNASEKDEDQSRRSRALTKLHTGHMLVMTGTPFRQSLGEVWKVVNWLHPGERKSDGSFKAGPLGGITGFLRTYGSIGQGTTAWGSTQEEALRGTLDPYTITEKGTPKTKSGDVVPHHEFTERVRPTEQQFGRIREQDVRYRQLRKEGVHQKKDATGRDALGRRMAAVGEIMAGGDKSTNPMLSRVHELAHKYYDELGERGIVHCVSKRAMRAVKASFEPGEVLTMDGDTNQLDRERIKQAMNKGLPVEGGAVSIGSERGMVTSVDRDFGGKKEGVYNIGVPVKVKVKLASGEEKEFGVEDVRSEVKVMAGTSVTSTGLNMQGTGYNIHLDAPDSAATKEQREARNYRRGREKPVYSHYLVPDLPTGRKKHRQIGEQRKVMKGIDDPAAYDQGSQYMDNVTRRHQARKDAEEELSDADAA